MTDKATSVGTSRSGSSGGTRTTALAPTTQALLRSAGNSAALAQRLSRQALDLQPTRSTSDLEGHHRPRAPVGEGKPDLGLPSYPG